MKNILLLVHDDGGQQSRLQVALDLARALSGHIQCLEAIHRPVVVDGFGGALAVLVEDEREREAAHRSRMEPRLASEDVSWSWCEEAGYLPECVADAARTADVIVLNHRLDDFGPLDMRHVITETLMDSRALVVAIQDSDQGFDASGKVLIAWDGSDRAMSVVKRAAPLLALASEVKLFQVGELDDGDIPVNDAAAYLSRHGIKAEVEIAPAADSIAVAIRLEAEQFGATYLLMGAYKHRPAREALFGGVTRAMLGACSLPLVLGH